MNTAETQGMGDAVPRDEVAARKCCARHRDRHGLVVRVIGHRPGDGEYMDRTTRLCPDCIGVLRHDPPYRDSYRVISSAPDGGA